MGDWRVGDLSRWGEDDQTAYVTTVPSGGSTHTKGAWVQLAASLPFDVEGLLISSRHAATIPFLLDLGVGAGGSEVVALADLQFGPTSGVGGVFYHCDPFWIPLRIPKGTRLSARNQSGGISQNLLLKVLLAASTYGKPGGYHRTLTIGADLATSTGTVATTGAIDTKGSWAELTASLAQSIKHILFSIVATTADVEVAVDIGIGAAASEVVVVPNIYHRPTNRAHTAIVSMPLAIPKGTRVAYRGKSSTATVGLRADLVGFS
jgi:hypothetical protein